MHSFLKSNSMRLEVVSGHGVDNGRQLREKTSSVGRSWRSIIFRNLLSCKLSIFVPQTDRMDA